MNTLSMMIYLSSIVHGLHFLIAMTMSLLIMFVIGAVLFCGLMAIEREYAELRKSTLKYIKFAIVPVFALGIMTVVIPSRTTILMIAASEMGQRALESTDVERVVDPSIELLTVWMKSEIAELKKNMGEKR